MSFGHYLKTKREEAGLSQAALAARCPGGEGIAQTTIGRWERGSHVPSVRQVGLLATALRLSERERLDALDHASRPDVAPDAQAAL